MGRVVLWLLLLALLPAYAQETYDWIVVLGAAQYGGRPSPALERRLQAALHLFREGRGRRIAVAGGKAPEDLYSEGEVGCRYLAARGVPEEALFCETRSRSTYENLLFLKPHPRGASSSLPTPPTFPGPSSWPGFWAWRPRGTPCPGTTPWATGPRRPFTASGSTWA